MVLKGTVQTFKIVTRFSQVGMKEVFYYTTMAKAFPEVSAMHVLLTQHSKDCFKKIAG